MKAVVTVMLKAGVPFERPALTVNRLCGSGIQSVVSAAHSMGFGEADVCLVGGMENMSQAPHVIRGARAGFKLGQGKLEDMLMVALLDTYCGCYMANTAENIANARSISRETQDEYAILSQQRAAAAKARGVFEKEIVPIEVGSGKRATLVTEDDHGKPDSTMEGLSRLPAAFGKDGTVTAGNASGIVDGAAALVVTTEEKAKAAMATLRKWRAQTRNVIPAEQPLPQFIDALSDDLNTAGVIAELHQLSHAHDQPNLLRSARLLGLLTDERLGIGSASTSSDEI